MKPLGVVGYPASIPGARARRPMSPHPPVPGLARIWSLVVTVAAISLLPSRAAAKTPGATLSRRVVSYEMGVWLEPAERTMTGTVDLTWTNPSRQPARELRFHLYYNAWRNADSSFLRSVRQASQKFPDHGPQDWAYSEVTSIALVENGRESADLTDAAEYIAPDDGNESDRTVLRVPLQQTVRPGQTIHVRYQFRAKVPRTFARTGVRGEYFFLAQWFPKIGVLQPDGTWNCHQFIQTEFFADFGNYDVRLTVPTGWVVGATGRQQSVTDNGDGSSTHRYVQGDVHDFTWTTSPHFRIHTAKFEHPELPPVDMRLLLMPDHAGKADRYLDATRATLRWYGTWYGAYPYGHVTVVDPAYGSGTGGMEYPTLFTGGTRWLSPREQRSPESVTVHEAGHQFWYGIVANDEFDHAWLDEGFNTYSTSRTLLASYEPARRVERYLEGFVPVVFHDLQRAERFDGADRYGGVRSDLLRDPMQRHSWRYGPNGYRVNSYDKPAMMLRTLEGYFGWKTFQRVLATYFERWKFRHPRPQDFFAVVEEVGGQDMDWFFDQIHADTVLFDYAVDTVRSRRVRVGRGYQDEPDGPIFVEDDDDDDDDARYASTVIVRRWGDGVFPIEVRVTFEDGSRQLEAWDGRNRWARWDYARAAPVQTVEIDPDRRLALDVDETNDSWSREPDTALASTKWAAKWMVELQHFMEFFALFG